MTDNVDSAVQKLKNSKILNKNNNYSNNQRKDFLIEKLTDTKKNIDEDKLLFEGNVYIHNLIYPDIDRELYDITKYIE
jgi:hypothetical protein